VGIEMGLESFAVTSAGEIIDNPRWFRAAEKGLRRKQRHASGCVPRSSGWRKTCQGVAKLHRRVFDQRHDFQQKLSRALVNHYGFLAVEDLRVEGLAGEGLPNPYKMPRGRPSWQSFAIGSEARGVFEQ
jgi:putative transposase